MTLAAEVARLRAQRELDRVLIAFLALRLGDVVGERDRARDTAARLEQELAHERDTLRAAEVVAITGGFRNAGPRG